MQRKAASIHNHFNQEPHLYNRQNFKLNRATALTAWQQLVAEKLLSLSFVV